MREYRSTSAAAATAAAPTSTPPAPDLAARIAELEAALRQLKQQRDEQLLLALGVVVGNRAFSARELWRHGQVSAELRAAFDQAGIADRRQLGYQLRRMRGMPMSHGLRLERIGLEEDGAVWILRMVADAQGDSCAMDPGGA